MKTTTRLAAVALAALALAAPAAAQQGQARPPRVGIGVGLPAGEFWTAAQLAGSSLPAPGGLAPAIYVPINVTPGLRIEPQIGYAGWSVDAGGGEGSLFGLGVGAFWVKPLAQQVQLYAGPRLVLQWASETGGGPTPQKREGNDLILAGALGGEFVPHPRFAVGAEASLGLVWVGDREVTEPGQPTTEDPGGSATLMQGTLFVRVYLF
jgi:hypothetical protein